MADTKKISQIKSSDNQIYNIDAKYWGSHSVEDVSTINGKSIFGNEDIVVVPKIEVTWDANSNMNNFKEPGFYEIYGERTVISDNLPILNAGGGHSFHANLTVLSSTLRPANNEICVTQILTLSNRLGGEGNMYVRTYNENNSPAPDWWTPWQKLQGVKEGYIFTDTIQVNPDGGVQQIDGVTGLNNMIDNGIYTGIYTDDPTFQAATFIDTFTLIVINNYAVVGESGGLLKRTISQLKYAVDALTNQSTIKKRTKTDGDSTWSDWTDIGGGDSIGEWNTETETFTIYNPVSLERSIEFGNSVFIGENVRIGDNTNFTNVEWTSESDMNDFKTPGTYNIYGERTRQDDNLPILNASSGHSIAANLTVVASTLQPDNNEICITQFLMLSNRLGGEGNMYIRTYNENNSPAANWWTPWQKLQGIREGYIFTDTLQVNPDGGVQQIEGVTGLNNMIDNGIYSGIYTDDPTFQSPTFIDTFTLIVINNYAVAGKDQRLKRTISQLKYSVDAITNQVSVKQRKKTDGDSDWSDWSEIGGGNNDKVIASALSDLDERIISIKNILNDKKIIQVTDSDYSKEIISNVKYIFTTPMNSIDISFFESEDVHEEYNLVFQSQSNMVLSLPENVCWANDEYPTFETDKIYELSIARTKINNISYYKAIIIGFLPTN